MISHVVRNAVLAALVTSAAVGATVGGKFGVPFKFNVDGPSMLAITDTNLVPLNSEGIVERGQCLTIGLIKEAAYQCGDLVTAFALPAVRVNGKTEAPALLYNSQLAHPHPLVTLDVAVPSGINVPGSITYVVKVNGVARDSDVVLTSTLLSAAGNNRKRIQVGWDATLDPTGVYPVTVDARSDYGGTSYTTSVSTEVIVVNRVNSPQGAGWSVTGVDRLFLNATPHANEVLWVGGDGSARVFRPTGVTNVWAADVFDRPDTLTFNADPAYPNTYQRRMSGGARVVFDAQGRHVDTIDPRGFISTLWYATAAADAPIIFIYPPKMSVPWSFFYAHSGADTVLDIITSPGVGSARITDVLYSGPRITRLGDPNSATAVGYVYDSLGALPNRMTQLIDRRLTATAFTYDAHGKLSLSVTDGQEIPARYDSTTVCPSFVLSSPVASCGTRFRETLDAVVSLDGPRPNYADADTSSFRVDRFGAPEMTRDALGHTTVVTRALISGCNMFPAFVTSVVAANGLTTNACTDSSGNMRRQIVVNGRGDGVADTTSYVWDRRWDKVTSIVDPAGQNTFMATYDGHGNPTSMGDSRVGSATTFSYGFSGNDASLLTGVVPPITRYPAVDRDSLIYDAMGNPTVFYSATDSAGSSHLNVAKFFANDVLGRVTDSCQNVTITTLPQCQETFYDIMSRDSVTWTYGYALNGVAAETVTVQKLFESDGKLIRLSRLKSGSATPLYTHYSYDRWGHLLSESAPTTSATPDPSYYGATIYGKTFRTYDKAGNMLSLTNRRGDVITMEYDGLNRLATKDVLAQLDTGVSPDSSIGRATSLYPYNTFNNLRIPAEHYVYGYDAMNHIVSAVDDSSRVYRTYYPNGLLQSDTLEITRAQGGAFAKYGLRNDYDRVNRRIALRMPGFLTGGDSTLHFSYDAVTSALASVTEPFGRSWSFAYDMRGNPNSLTLAGNLTQTLERDGVDNIMVDSLWQSTAGVLRASRFTYDNRGLLLTVSDPTTFGETDVFKYSGLGHMISSHIAQRPSNGAGVSGYGGVAELTSFDALGNILTLSTYDTVTKRIAAGGGSGSASSSITNSGAVHTLDSLGRLSSVFDGGTGPDSSIRTYHYDADGNVIFFLQMPRSWAAPYNDGYREDRYSFYDAEGRLRAADYRVMPTGGLLAGKSPDIVFEQYQYDALGRRYRVRTDRFCGGNVELDCARSTLRRTIWDGDRELVEVQVPVHHEPGFLVPDSVTDSDQFVATYGIVSGGVDHNPYFGRVLYIPGLALDQPVGINRYNYTNRTNEFTGAVEPLVTIAAATMSLLWDQKGRLSRVWCSTGAERCTGTRAGVGGGNATELVSVPENYFFVDRPRFHNYSWQGTLLVDKEDGTRTNFRRNRYYDPTSGRFTQEDPIGLAGGLNLYGFAGGDPVNFGDPFGLCPDPKDPHCTDLPLVEITTNRNIVKAAAIVAGGGVFGRIVSAIVDFAMMVEEPTVIPRSPKPSPNFETPTNAAQSPPSILPDGHTIRLGEPTSQYPNGYWRQYNAEGQPVNPLTGKPPGNVTRAQSRADTHVPLPPDIP